jgi:hypothetical protein
LVEKVKTEERDSLKVSGVFVVVCWNCVIVAFQILHLSFQLYAIVKLFVNEEKPHNIQEAIFRG